MLTSSTTSTAASSNSSNSNSMSNSQLQRIHLNARRCVKKCHSDPRILHMKLDCLVLDRLNSEYIVSFLRRTPRIRQLCLDCCKITQDAYHVWMHYFRDVVDCTIQELDVFGDYNVSQGRFAEIDDGSVVECLARALKGNKSVVDLWLWGLEPFVNERHVKNLLFYKRNLRKFKLEDCCMNVGFKIPQTNLHAFYLNMEYLPLDGTATATLVQALLAGGAPNLSLLHLENCGMTVPLIRAVLTWMTTQGCHFGTHDPLLLGPSETTNQDQVSDPKNRFLALLKSSPQHVFVRELSFYTDDGGDAFLDLVQDDLLPFLQRNQILIQRKTSQQQQQPIKAVEWNVYVCGETWGC